MVLHYTVASPYFLAVVFSLPRVTCLLTSCGCCRRRLFFARRSHCCSGVLAPSGVCCASGLIDSCGVCDGRHACDTDVALVLDSGAAASGVDAAFLAQLLGVSPRLVVDVQVQPRARQLASASAGTGDDAPRQRRSRLSGALTGGQRRAAAGALGL